MTVAPLKILMLEDFEDDANLIKFQLMSGGIKFEAKVVKTKEDYEDALENFYPDAVLCDHTLPQFDSIRALKILRRTKRNIPFILVTGSVSEEFAVQMIHAGAHDYIIKDRLTRLPAALTNALQRCHSENERMKYFNEVLANEALFKKAEKVAHFGIWEHDLIKDVTKWSDETYRILAYEVGEVIPSQETFLKNIHPEDKERIKEIINKTYPGNNTVKMEFRIVNKNRSSRNVVSEFLVEYDDKGGAIRITGFDMDITEQKKAEEEKRKIEQEYQAIYKRLIFHLENTPLGFIEWDKDLNVISWSKRAEEIFGWPEKEFKELRKSGFSQVHIEDLREANRIAAQILNGEIERNTVLYRCYTKDGRVIWTEWFNSALRDNDGKIVSILSLVQDITSRKNDEIERNKITTDLFIRNKDLEQFTYIVSHNLRAPVANILGFQEELISPDCTDEERIVLRKELSASIKRLDQIIIDLNDILNIKSSVTEKKEQVVFSQIMDSITAGIKELIDSGEVKIITDFALAAEIASVKSYIYSIFYNLISNAIKYKQSGISSVIQISSFIKDGKLYLTFKDNGMGIDLQKVKDHIFGLYKRFHHDIEGKGVGLFMVRAQVNALDGKINIESELNKGTTFTLEFNL